MSYKKTGMSLSTSSRATRRILRVWNPALFSERTTVPFLQCPLYIKKCIFIRFKRRGRTNFPGASSPAPIFSFPMQRDCNEDHWVSRRTMPVDFPHYFFRLSTCKTIFKSRIFVKRFSVSFCGLDPRPQKFLVAHLDRYAFKCQMLL